jgi:hypothetical protein
MGGQGGSVVDAGAGGSPGSTTLRLKIAPGSSYCDTGISCSPAFHITVRNQAGAVVGGTPPFCYVLCSAACVPMPCPAIACFPYDTPFTGEERVFSGLDYEASTCGAGTACVRQRFLPPGRYVAVMCATPGQFMGPDGGGRATCTKTGPPECVEVPFDFPSSTPVEVTLGLSSSRDR